jgi:hypothetical protein
MLQRSIRFPPTSTLTNGRTVSSFVSPLKSRNAAHGLRKMLVVREALKPPHRLPSLLPPALSLLLQKLLRVQIRNGIEQLIGMVKCSLQAGLDFVERGRSIG